MTEQEELQYLRDQIQLERDELARRLHASQTWDSVRSVLIDAGCPLETNCHVPTAVRDWLDASLAKQPQCAQKLTAAGWKFEWQPDTGFVAAEHPLGGKQSVAEVCGIARTGFDRYEIGEAIAKLLQG